MAAFQYAQTIDLNNPRGQSLVQQINGHVGDALAHTWKVTLVRGSSAEDLTGYTAMALHNRKDGATLEIVASISGNVVTVTFPQASYIYEGQGQTVLLRLTKAATSEETVVAGAQLNVGAGETGTPTDPGTSIATTLSGLLASEAARVEAETARAAFYDGFSSQLAAKATKAEVGAVQSQIDVLVVEGDSSVESAQARVNATGTTFGTLKGRLDNSDAYLSAMALLPAQFAQSGDADDTASINRMLAHINTLGGGKCRIPYKDGGYTLSSALTIYGNTDLEVDPNAVIKLADDVNCRMMENANKTTQASLTRVDKNITIRGGIWDGNGASQSKKWDADANTSSIMSGFLFSGINGFVFAPTKIINTRAYATLICNVSSLLIENVDVSVGGLPTTDNVDGIHILGPAENITIQNCALASEDNVIAINANDVGHGPYGTFGNISNVRIKDITLNNTTGGQGMLLLSGAYSIKDVHVENITGSAAYLMNISTFDMGVGDYDDITIKNVNLTRTDPTNYHQFVMIRGGCGTISLENFKIKGNATTVAGTRLLSAFTTSGTPVTSIKNLNIRNIEANNLGSSSGWADLVCLYEGVTVDNLDIRGLKSKDNIYVCNPLHLEPVTVTNLSISDVDVDNADNGLIYKTGSTAPTISNLRTAGVVLDDMWVSDVQQAWVAPTLINSWAKHWSAI